MYYLGVHLTISISQLAIEIINDTAELQMEKAFFYHSTTVVQIMTSKKTVNLSPSGSSILATTCGWSEPLAAKFRQCVFPRHVVPVGAVSGSRVRHQCEAQNILIPIHIFSMLTWVQSSHTTKIESTNIHLYEALPLRQMLEQ